MNVCTFTKAQVKVAHGEDHPLWLVRVMITKGKEGVHASAPLIKALHHVTAWSITTHTQLTFQAGGEKAITPKQAILEAFSLGHISLKLSKEGSGFFSKYSAAVFNGKLNKQSNLLYNLFF